MGLEQKRIGLIFTASGNQIHPKIQYFSIKLLYECTTLAFGDEAMSNVENYPTFQQTLQLPSSG
jgi:hypothetical protein